MKQAAWSEWESVAGILDAGHQSNFPWEPGVYRFRTQPDHGEAAGEIVYIGRGGKEGGTDNSALVSRIGTFIASAMGFQAPHSGGNRFHTEREAGAHGLTVRDLEVSFRVDPDSTCAEAEAIVAAGALPRFNRQAARTCRRDECPRAAILRDKHEVW